MPVFAMPSALQFVSQFSPLYWALEGYYSIIVRGAGLFELLIPSTILFSLFAITFALSTVIPGMVGAVMALRSTYFEVLQVFSPTISFTIVTIAIIGGAGDARGPVLGAVFLIALSETLRGVSPQLYLVFLGLSLIFFVRFVPNGLTGLLRGGGR